VSISYRAASHALARWMCVQPYTKYGTAELKFSVFARCEKVDASGITFPFSPTRTSTALCFTGMAEMRGFESLPQALGRQIVELWLDAHSVVMLDRAYCSKETRAQFLETLTGTCLRNIVRSKHPYRIGKVRNAMNFVRWLQKMNMEVETFIVPVAFLREKDAMQTWMQKVGHRVTSVRFEQGWRREHIAAVLKDIAQCFLNVVAIDVSDYACGRPVVQDSFGAELCEVVSGWNLQKIVANDTGLSDASVTTIAVHSPNLMHLNVSGCSYLTSASIGSVAQSCPALRYLNLNGTKVGNDVVAYIGLHCPLLQHLDVAKTNVSGGTLGYLADYCPDLIYLAGYTWDSDLMGFGSGCPKLQTLLNPYEGVGDDGVVAIAEGCPRVRVLDLGDTEYLTCEGLCALAHCSRWLQVLRLCGCVELEDDGVIELVYSCHLLRELQLTFCEALTDDTADAIADYGEKLQVLNVLGCLEISVEGIRLIGKLCRNLCTVSLCPHIVTSGA
jgi:hypothetical protein